MPSRVAIIFSASCAIAAGGFAAFSVEKDGDPQARIDQVKEKIKGIDALLGTYTIRIVPTDSPKPTKPGVEGFVVTAPSGKSITVEAPAGIKVVQLYAAADEYVKKGRSEHLLVDAAWAEAETWWQGLSWANREAAETIALTYFPRKPDRVSGLDWDKRAYDSKFQVEEQAAYELRRISHSAGVFGGVFVGLLVIVLGTGWLWRALLARLKELSSAIRGRS